MKKIFKIIENWVKNWQKYVKNAKHCSEIVKYGNFLPKLLWFLTISSNFQTFSGYFHSYYLAIFDKFSALFHAFLLTFYPIFNDFKRFFLYFM